MEQKQQFKCTGECINCPRVQHEYCAAQKALENQRMLIEMTESLKQMQCTVAELKEKITAIQDSEALVFDPNEEKSEIPTLPIAQEGVGAEE